MPNFDRNIFDLPGIQRVFSALDPGEAPCGTRNFPNREGWGGATTRHSGESNSTWINNIIREVASSRGTCTDHFSEVLGDCEVSEGLVVLASYDWLHDFVINCSVQILVTDGESICQLIDDSSVKSYYYRLDISDTKRGMYFNHPMPHVHCSAKDKPRFPWKPRPDEFFLLSFLEFIILNYRPNIWLGWLTELSGNSDEWWRFEQDILPDDFLKRYSAGEPLERIPQARERLELLEQLAITERRIRASQREFRFDAPSLGYWMT